MGDISLIRTALLVALITAFGFAATGRAPAAEPPAPMTKVAGSEAASSFVPLGTGEINRPRP
jgi:hypothetical protein